MAAVTFLSEDFVAPDGVLLEDIGTGLARSTVSGGNGAMQVMGGRASMSSSANAVYCWGENPAPSPDYEVSAKHYFASAAGNPSVGVCGRMAGPGGAPLTFYQARFVNNTSGLVLARFLNGTTVTLLSTPMNYPAGAEPLLTLKMEGDQLSVLVDGVVLLGPHTDATIPDAGYVGIRMASANVNQIRIDEVRARTIDDGPSPIGGSLSATLEAAIVSSSVQIHVASSLSSVLASATLASAAALASTADLTKTLSPAVLSARASVEAELPGPDGIEGALSKILAGATLAATASVAVKGALSSTLAGAALAATARTATALDILEVHSSRVVVFGGSGSRVVVFEGSGSRVVVFEGSGKRIRIKQMDVKVPIKDGSKWKVDRDRDEISYYAADITDELRDRNTTAVQSEVVALPYGVEVLEEAQIQIATIEGIERTFVVVKLGGVDGELPDDWRWVARVPCANGERFDKTTWFNEVDP
ncbi:hypothetical protein [Massilia timonae]|uniref:hypothetical protein n=1 Tax=Massilia timonae TaxID=47229 RepID=UPI0023527651|nr:hypothetical protein [Massilia timonae]